MSLRAATLRLKHFAGVDELEITFGEKRTRIIGPNKSGKSVLLNALWALFKGIAEKSSAGQFIGSKPYFITDGAKSADIELTLVDGDAKITCKRHITKSAHKISFEAPDGYPVSGDWLLNLLNTQLINATQFCALPGKEQTRSIGVDVSPYDEKTKELKEAASLVRKQLANVGEPIEVHEVDFVSIALLAEDQRLALEYNSELNERIRNRDDLYTTIGSRQDEIDQLAKVIEEKREILESVKQEHADILADQFKNGDDKFKNVDDIAKKIATAEETNIQAQAYQDYKIDCESKEAFSLELKANKNAQANVDDERVAYLQGFNFGFKEISIDDDGELLIAGRPVKPQYFSRSELEMLVATLHAGLDPELKIIWIDNFEAFDPPTQDKLLTRLFEKGFQVITAEVGVEKVEGDNVVFLGEAK